MKTQCIIPNPKITSYVEKILVLENDETQKPFVMPLYANGFPTLLFKTGKGKLGNRIINDLTLFGQTILPVNLSLSENFKLIAYFLKPHALFALYGIPAFELTDNPVDLNLFSSKKTIALQNQLLNCENINDMISMIDNYIFSLVNASNCVSESIKYASEKIASHYSKVSLLEIQKELKISERTFQRIFEKNIGILPNTYRRICQFNSAFADLYLGKYSKLSDIAYNHGFADQSHYIKSFKEFTTITPKDYLKYANQ